MIQIQHLARFPDIGSNSCLLQLGETRVVLDAGTHPKHTGHETLPMFESIELNSLDAIIVSHPHLDHIGALPCLMQQHPNAAVAMTEATRESGEALLHNSVNVMKSQRHELGIVEYPLYSHRKVDELERFWFTRGVGETFSFGHTDRVECEFFHAGHVQGAVGVQLTFEGKKIFYTGDVHFEDQSITPGAQFPREKIHTLIMETTRGDYQRPQSYTRENERNRLGEKICEVLDRGGSILIPVFAFGKTQELLIMLHELREEGLLPVVPVHIGGLSTRMTQISDLFRSTEFRLHPGFRLLEDFEALELLPRGHKEPVFQPGRIYALSSGMMAPHTVSNRFARHILSSEKNALLFVGYAEDSTPAGKILAQGKGGSVQLTEESERETKIKCDVERFDFSGHAPREQLAQYAIDCDPDHIILVHGDPVAKAWFEKELQRKLPSAKISVPKPGQWLDLD